MNGEDFMLNIIKTKWLATLLIAVSILFVITACRIAAPTVISVEPDEPETNLSEEYSILLAQRNTLEIEIAQQQREAEARETDALAEVERLEEEALAALEDDEYEYDEYENDEEEAVAGATTGNQVPAEQTTPTATPPAAAPPAQATPPAAATAPPVTPAPAAGSGSPLAGRVTITDNTTPAVVMQGHPTQAGVMAFEAAGGQILGTMSAANFITVRDSVRVTRNGRVGYPPDSRYDTSQWDLWFADEFNRLRGVSGAAVVTPLAATPAPGTPAPPIQNLERERQELLRLVNEERARRGVHLLEACPDLMEFAQIRAGEGVRAGGGDHTRPNGDRVRRENWTSVTTAQRAFERWMDSPGHRAPIVAEPGTWGANTYTVGIGISSNGTFMIFDRIVLE